MRAMAVSISGMGAGVMMLLLSLPNLPVPALAYSPTRSISRLPTPHVTSRVHNTDQRQRHRQGNYIIQQSSSTLSRRTSLWSTMVDPVVETLDILSAAHDEDTVSTSNCVISTTTSTTTTTTTTTKTATSTISKTKSYLDDGFVFGLDGSGLERPKGKQAQLVVEGDSLETKPWQVALVWGTLLGHACFLTTSILGMFHMNGGNTLYTTFQATILLLSSWTLADFGSGVLHWSVDNYGNGRTPIMGGIIAAFQGHHSAPWTITQRGFANNVCKLCIPFGVVTVTLFNGLLNVFGTGNVLVGQHYSASFFFTVFCVMEILSQEFHKWSHTTKGEVPTWVNTLQQIGLTIGRKPHAQHHIAPYDGNYCIISGICNPWLDKSGFFRRLEHIVYRWNGIESNAWKLDQTLRERTLRGEYRLPEVY